MLVNICKILSDNPDDLTVFINDIVAQKIIREDLPFAERSDSFRSFLNIFSVDPRLLFNPRIRKLRFLAVGPSPIPRRKSAVQPGRRRACEEVLMDVFEASRAGRPDALLELVRTAGPGQLQLRDKAGHTAAHWAALEGHADVVRFLIAQGVPVDVRSEHALGQRPLHWAAANGCVQVMRELLQAGADINAPDTGGATPLITAAQYGQAGAAAFLMARGAGLQLCDKEGDSALHWAAFRGRPDLVRLFVYSGLNPHQRDHFGQSALHLAASSGNLCTVRDLVRCDGVSTEIRDQNNRTPLALAFARRHDDVTNFLRKEASKGRSLWDLVQLRSIIFGPPGRQRQSQIGFVLITVLLLYPTFLLKIFPLAWPTCPNLVCLFFAANVLAWVSFAKSSFLDPGYLPRNQPEYDRQMRAIGTQEQPPDLNRLCHSCKALKPVRAKHCRICDRCVAHMDHHCPYIYNCVGYKNRAWFFCFTYTTLFIAILSFYFLNLVLSSQFDLLLLLLLPIGLFGFSVVGLMGSCLWLSVLQNLTTNEMANRKRYAYLKNSRGLFRNPFDRGCFANLLEYFHLRPAKELPEENGLLIL